MTLYSSILLQSVWLVLSLDSLWAYWDSSLEFYVWCSVLLAGAYTVPARELPRDPPSMYDGLQKQRQSKQIQTLHLIHVLNFCYYYNYIILSLVS